MTGRAWRWVAGVAAVLLVAKFAPRTVVAVMVLAIAVVFVMLVAIAALVTLFAVDERVPSYLLGRDGVLLPYPQRVRAVAREGLRWARSKPWRSPGAVVTTTSRRLEVLTWNDHGTAWAYSSVAVRLHPRTAEALGDWMPLPELAELWAGAYARAHRSAQHRSGYVALSIVADDGVPLGVAELDGRFQHLTWPGLLAWARISAIDGGVVATGPAERIRENSGEDTQSLTGVGSVSRGPASPGAGSDSQRQGWDHTAVLDLPSAELTQPVGWTFVTHDRLVLTPCGSDGSAAALGDVRTVDFSPARVGRGSECEIAVTDEHVSRVHAQFARGGDSWTVEDLGSSHGTRVNGAALGKQQPHALSAGDIVEFGAVSHPLCYRVTLATTEG